MKRSLCLAAAGLSTLGLASCATIVDAPAGPYKVSSGYTVTLGREWSDMSKLAIGTPKVHMLTVDGPLLNRLYVIDGLAPGEYIVKATNKESATPTYRSGMAPTELVEFVRDSVSALSFQRVTTSGLKPVKFGDVDGIRMSISGETQDGLEYKGLAQFAEVKGKLYVVLYIAPAEHYYGATLSEAEGVMASAHVGG
jgi:hypothetical protein